MSPKEMGELIIEWAKSRTEPFMTADAFNEIHAAQDAKEISDALGFLYRKELLARKKINNVRFSYALPEIAPDGYETIRSEMAKALLVNEMQSEHEVETKPPADETKPAVMETKLPIDETPNRKIEKKSKTAVTQNCAEDGRFSLVAQEGQVEIPDSFVLSLRTPSGFVITITAPGAK